MDVKEAVRTALAHIRVLFEEEKISHVGLEEVVFESGEWAVTVGFSRPWHYAPELFPTVMQPKPNPQTREYKVVRIDDRTGKVVSVLMRNASAA